MKVGSAGGAALGGAGGLLCGPGAVACSPIAGAAMAAGGGTLGCAAGGTTGYVVGGLVEDVVNYFCEDDEAESKERRCEENLDRDLATCKALGKRNGASAYKICEGQAMARYARCLQDSDIQPPLPPWGTK